jgi:hypothetical protein
MNLRFRQIRLDGTESRTRELTDVHRIEGEYDSGADWTRIWFEGEGHTILATEVSFGRGRIEIEAI